MDNTEAVEKLAKVVGFYYETQPEVIAREILAAIQVDPLAYVKPKPLEFVHGVAESGAGRYVIESVLATDGMRRVIWACDPDESDPFYMYQNGIGAKDEKAAQAAAYEDLCNRVKELFC